MKGLNKIHLIDKKMLKKKQAMPAAPPSQQYGKDKPKKDNGSSGDEKGEGKDQPRKPVQEKG